MLRTGPLPHLLAISSAFYAVALLIGEPLRLTAACGSLGLELVNGTLSLWAATVSPVQIAFAWFVMLLAMMPPGLALPVHHIWISSFLARRLRATAWFAAGYVAVWLCAGLFLVPGAALMAAALPGLPGIVAGAAFALVWSSSPIAQSARNACHRLLPISPFGFRADRDCLIQGAATAIACVASCWPWMVAALLWRDFHLIAMALATGLLLIDRVSPPLPPRWRTPPCITVPRAAFRSHQKTRGRP